MIRFFTLLLFFLSITGCSRSEGINPVAGQVVTAIPTAIVQGVSMLHPVSGVVVNLVVLYANADIQYTDARISQMQAEGGYRPLTSSEQTSLAMSVMPIAILKTALTALFGWLMLISVRSLIRKLRSTKE